MLGFLCGLWLLCSCPGTVSTRDCSVCATQPHADPYPEFAPDTYRFIAPHIRLVVRLVPLVNPHAASLTWKTAHQEHQQYLRMPYGWWPTTRYHEGVVAGQKALPCALLWRTRSQTCLIVVGQRASGVYDYCCPIIYRFHAGYWRLTSDQTKLLQFSDRGSFYTRGPKLYIWDYRADWNIAHGSPQRYWLREFAWRTSRMKLLATRITRGKYEDIQGLDNVDNIPCGIPPPYDPLREFGLKWQWWAKPGVVQ